MADVFKQLDPNRDITYQTFPSQNPLISATSQATAVTNNITIFSIGPFNTSVINTPDSLGSTTAGISPSGLMNSITKTFFNRHGAQYFSNSANLYTLPRADTINVNVDTARLITVSDPTRSAGIYPDTLTAVLHYSYSSFTAVDRSVSSIGPNKESLSFGKLTDINDPTLIYGTIFYDYGLVLLHGGTGSSSALTLSSVTGFAFAGSVTGALTASTSASTIVVDSVTFSTYTMLNRALYACTLEFDEFNYTSNPSANGVAFLENENNVETFVTTIGLADDRQNILAIAKISPAYRKNRFKKQTFIVSLSI